MKIAIFGARGSIGSRIVAEARHRGHEVTAVVRPGGSVAELPTGIAVVPGDVTDPGSIASSCRGHDAVVSAVGGAGEGRFEVVVEAARALIAGLPRAGVERLLVVGGAGSLEDDDGSQLVDAPDFPAAWKPASLAQREALAVYRAEGGAIDWAYLSPADVIEPGERTGSFALGGDRVVRNAAGESRISIEDYAVALVDELERGEFVRARFTLAYT